MIGFLIGATAVGVIMLCIGLIYLGLLSIEPAPSTAAGASFWLWFIPIGFIMALVGGVPLLLIATGLWVPGT